MIISTEFIITTSYSLFSCILYTLLGYILIKNKQEFSGSYYNIIFIDSVVNVFSYFACLVPLRLPRATCKDCLLTPYLNKIPGLNLFGCLFNHFPYVQYLMILSLIFNRFTAVAYSMQYKKIWKRLFIPLMLFNLVSPLVFSYPWFTVVVTFEYYEQRDAYILVSKPDIYATVNVYLVTMMIVLTLLSTALMVATVVLYLRKVHTRIESIETGLLSFNLIYFLVQLVAVTVMLIPFLDALWGIPIFTAAGRYLIPYASDGLTFSSPYVLLLCCRRLRTLLKQMLFGCYGSRNGTVSVISVH